MYNRSAERIQFAQRKLSTEPPPPPPLHNGNKQREQVWVMSMCVFVCCCCTLFSCELYVITTNTFDSETKNALRCSGQRPSASSIDAATAARSVFILHIQFAIFFFFHNMYNFRCEAKAVAPVLLSCMHCTQNKSALASTMAPNAVQMKLNICVDHLAISNKRKFN